MDYNEPIKFQQERDFGQVFNATFGFIKQEFRGLSQVFLRYCGPLILLTIIVSTLMQYRTSWQGFNYYDPGSLVAETLLYLFAYILLAIATYTMLLAVINGYISIYAEKGKDGFTPEDVWQSATSNFWRILIANILKGLVIGFGTILCFLPGIYLAISLCMLIIIMVHEKIPFGMAFSRTFELTHLRWWWTLLLLLVLYLIIYLISLVFAIPAFIIGFTTALNTLEPGGYSDSTVIILAVVNIISSLVSYILMVMPVVAIAFQFFAIRESKEKPDLMDKIDQIN